MKPKPFKRREKMRTKKIVMGILAVLLVVFLAESSSAQDWGDGWWDPSESGWGMNVIHQSDVMFVCLYVYDQDGSPHWYSASLYAGISNTYGFTTYQGQLVATTGPWFGGTYNPQAVNIREVGSMTFSPSTAYRAELSYTVDGVAVSKQIERFTFRHIPLSGFYHGATVVKSNNCPIGPAPGTVGTISMDISETANPGTASGQITAINYEDGTYSCTMSGTYQQFGAIYEATTNDCLNGSYVQVTDFIPSEISFSADSVIYGPAGCTIVYSMSAVKAQTPPAYTVNATVVNSAGGSVLPSSQTGVSHGSTTTFMVTINANYTASVSEGSLSGTTGTVVWTTAPVTSSHTVTVTFTSSGDGLGSKTNPIPLNKTVQAGYLYPSNGGGASGCQVSVSGKVYFMLDPSPSSMTWTRLTIKGYSNVTLKYWKQAQTKAGQDIGGEVSIYNSQGDGMDDEIDDAPYDFSTTRFLYAVEGTQAIDIFVQYWNF
jgi:hypothetical protein